MLGKLRRPRPEFQAVIDTLEKLATANAQQNEVLTRGLAGMVAASADLGQTLGRKLDEVIASSANQTDLIDRKLGEFVEGSSNQTDVLNRKLGEAIDGDANLADLLNQRFGELIKGNAEQTELLSRKLGEVIDGDANLADLLNQRFGELIKCNAEQTELLSRKLGEVTDGDANLAGLLNRKLEEVIDGGASLTDLLNRKLEEVIDGGASLADLLNRKLEEVINGGANLADLLNRKLEEVINGDSNLADLINRKLEEVIDADANLADLLNRKFGELIERNAGQADLLNRTLGETVNGNANLADLLNRKLGELIERNAKQGDLLNRKLDTLTAGIVNQRDVFNRKIVEAVKGITNLCDLVDRKTDEIIVVGGTGRYLLRSFFGSAVAQTSTGSSDLQAAKNATGRAPVGHRLKVICTGTGRDGSSSLAQMITKLSELTGAGFRVSHEYKSREFFDIFCRYRETGDRRFLETIEDMIATCPDDCIVGGGYAALLPIFAEKYGPQLKLVHLRRADRARFVESIKENCELFPAAYRYYSSSSEARYKRIAAFHFNEMNPDEWDRLSIDEKFGWYYDKTHSLIDQHTNLFANHVAISTESINEEATRSALARLIVNDDSVLPPPIVTNHHYLAPKALPPGQAEIAQWMLQEMNIMELGKDHVYLLEYAVSRLHQFFSAAVEREISGSGAIPADVQAATARRLNRASRALLAGLDRFADLRDRLK